MKTCKKCGVEKEKSFFRKRVKPNGKVYYGNTCRQCISFSNKEYKKQYYIDNKEYINNKNAVYYENNKEKLIEENKKYYENNKEKILEEEKLWLESINGTKEYTEYREKCNISNKKYRDENKEKAKEYQQLPHVRRKKTLYTNIRRREDVAFKLRSSVSRSVHIVLKGEKNNLSILNYLPYTIDELKQHLESLFEHWMNWENWGVYNPKAWDDNNTDTWKWNLDHIIPQSDLLYTSMEDENFQKCWALENLRPYNAKQNIIDGASKTRHKKAA